MKPALSMSSRHGSSSTTPLRTSRTVVSPRNTSANARDSASRSGCRRQREIAAGRLGVPGEPPGRGREIVQFAGEGRSTCSWNQGEGRERDGAEEVEIQAELDQCDQDRGRKLRGAECQPIETRDLQGEVSDLAMGPLIRGARTNFLTKWQVRGCSVIASTKYCGFERWNFADWRGSAAMWETRAGWRTSLCGKKHRNGISAVKCH